MSVNGNPQKDRFRTALLPYGVTLIKETTFWFLRDGPVHAHDDIQLVIVLGGEIVLRYAALDLPMRRGDVALVPAGVVHTVLAGDPQTPVRLLDVRFAAPGPTQLTQFVGELPAGAVLPADERGVLRAAEELSRAAQERGWRRAPRLLAALWELLATLQLSDSAAPAAAHPDLTDRRLRLAEAFMLEHLAEPIDVGAIAAAAGLSRSQLNRLFRREVGVGPAERLRSYRLDAARRLLSDGSMSVKEVAHAVGFPWIHHFTRCYRRAHGCTPSADRGTERPAAQGRKGKPGGRP